MSEWRDIFQFSRAETFALSILLLMVLIGGGILLYENSTETLPPDLFFQSAGAATTHLLPAEPTTDAGMVIASTERTDSISANKKLRSISTQLMLNINTAPAESLMMLPRIGAVMSQRSVELRKKLGRFDSPEQLVQVRGIGNKTLELIRPYVTLGALQPGDTLKCDSASTHK
jgi:competence ComEA-like helix-hairpin-helix protein